MSDYTPSLMDGQSYYVTGRAQIRRQITGENAQDITPYSAEFDRMIEAVRAETLTDLKPDDLADLLQGISESLEGLANRAALRRAADVLRLLVPDEQADREEDQGPAAGCAYCVGAGGYEDYDGEWRECSCQRANRKPSDAEVEAAADAIVEASFGQELPEAPIDLARAALLAAQEVRNHE